MVSGDGGRPAEVLGLSSGTLPVAPTHQSLMVSASFKERRSSSRRRGSVRPNVDADNEFITLLHGSDPVRVELNRLENEVRDKDRELVEAQAEIKALKLSERQREKAIEELTEGLSKVEEKLKLTEQILENKNLEIKKINEEKKASMAAQFAAEAMLRRVHAAQKDNDMHPIEVILAPLEAELKLAKQEIVKLQDDNKALDRIANSKEAALLEAERTIQVALAKASMVDDLQNKNQELVKQIEICQEENKILEKLHRTKVGEVEKLTQTRRELEEAVLAGGVAANAVRDGLKEVALEVTANRVATVVANEWKDGNDKVMPVKQWLEDRRFLQGEMQQLRDKLVIAEGAARSESLERYQLRVKVIEESLKGSSGNGNPIALEGRSFSNGPSRRQSLGGAANMSWLAASGLLSRKSSSQSKSFSSGATFALKDAKGTSRSFDGEVVTLRKAYREKDQSFKDKDDAIEMLAKKVDTLTKAMEVEAKKMRREVTAMEKEVAAMRVEKEHKNRTKRFANSKYTPGTSQLLAARTAARTGLTRSTQ
ncbi:hypothetical protein MLD38_005432 [Melastoma candidum]|uniref:Uncharacterized protein n=1 Tax=Melastoma candidum TaxID=119954 RepID=A0ACB9RJQ2_9MYRT|nr:hypothetical protein MLD38_005432 [Melastoma candidum]